MRTLDVVAYAGEELGGVKPANFLDIGGGASAEVMANGLEIILCDPRCKSVFVNVFGGITACDAVANGIVQAFELLQERGETITKPLVVRLDGNNADEGRRILDDAEHAAGRAGRHDGRRRAPRGRARRSRGVEGRRRWRSSSTETSQVIVQGMTGSEGTKHTRRMLASGTNDRRRRQPAQGRPDRRRSTAPRCRSSASVAEAMKETGADVSVVFVPPPFAKAAVVEAVDAGIPLVVVITEGVPVHDTAAFFQYAQSTRARPGSSGRTAPA